MGTSIISSLPNQLNIPTGFASDGGSFVWDGTVDKSLADYGTIIDPSVPDTNQGQGVGLGCWVRQYSGAVNVRWFEMIGDGVTDYTETFQKIISRHEEIYLPSGDFVINNCLFQNNKATRIHGLGKIINTDGQGSFNFSYPVQNLIIEGVKFRMEQVSDHENGCINFKNTPVKSVSVRNCQFEYEGPTDASGIVVMGNNDNVVSDLDITGNTFTGFTLNAIRATDTTVGTVFVVRKGVVNLSVKHNKITTELLSDTRNIAIEIKNIRLSSVVSSNNISNYDTGIKASGCIKTLIKTNDMEVKQYGIILTGVLGEADSQENLVTNNIVVPTFDAVNLSVVIENSDNIFVHANQFNASMHINSSNENIITNNFLLSAEPTIINMINTTNNNIRENIIKSIATPNVALVHADNCDVSNVFENNKLFNQSDAGEYIVEINGAQLYRKTNFFENIEDLPDLSTQALTDFRTIAEMISLGKFQYVIDHTVMVNNYYNTYLGAHSSIPATRTNGDPLEDGDMYFHAFGNLSEMRVWRTDAWDAVTSLVEQGIVKLEFTATAAQTVYTPGVPFVEGNIDVYVDGVKLPTSAYSDVGGNDITFVTPFVGGEWVAVNLWGTIRSLGYYTTEETDALISAHDDAVELNYDNTASGLAATNVQDAMDEVEARVESNENDISSGTTAMMNHVNSTEAHALSSITFDNTATGLTATDAQTAFNEAENRLDVAEADIVEHKGSITAHQAAAITYNPGVSGMAATNVQTAINEGEARLDTAEAKLAGIEDNATRDQTAGEILTLLKTVDGAGSGLDADLLDGLSSGSYLRSDATDYFHRNNGVLYINNTDNQSAASTSGSLAPIEIKQNIAGKDAFMSFHVGGDYATYFGLDGATNDLFVGGWSKGAAKYKIWHSGNDGSGSGLDADLLDGRNSTGYLKQVNANGYDGIADSAGGTANWIRTTSNGLLPYGSGGASSLGTASWPFQNIYGNNIYDNGVELGAKFLGITAKAADSDLLDGYHGSAAATANTYGLRDSAGDITARLFRSTYAEQTTAPAATADIAFRNSTTDNYIRFMDKTAFIAYLGIDHIGGPVAVRHYGSTTTWYKPANVRRIKVEVVGGGGGGAGYGESGGAGGYASEIITNPPASVTVTIGGGGGGTSYSAVGGRGGTSSFGAYCSGTGGYGSNANRAHSGGHGGSGSGGNVNIQGGGGLGHVNSGIGYGGASYFGGPAAKQRSVHHGKLGSGAYGSGGSGSHTTHYGAAGTAGCVIVWEYE